MNAYCFKLCCLFSLPIGVCIVFDLMSISAAYVTIGSYILRVSTNYTFATVNKGRHTKEMSVIVEPAHVAVRLQLLEMSSITTANQTISNVCTRHNIFKSSFFRKIIGDFYRSATMKKCSTVIACKRNRSDFWNLCKRLQNFVNLEALTAIELFFIVLA